MSPQEFKYIMNNIKLKYTGKLGYLEARYRLGLGNREELLKKVNELKNSDETLKKVEPDVQSEEFWKI